MLPREDTVHGITHAIVFRPHVLVVHLAVVKRTVLIYGLAAGVMVVALRLVEYRFLVVEHSLEIYGGLVAFLFAGLGIWLGQKLTRPPERVVTERIVTEHHVSERVIVQEVLVHAPTEPTPFAVNIAALERLGVTPRELEILTLIAEGLSNREIGQRLFVSENTVKTHSANLFAKLGARRRIQAVQLGRDAGIIA
jgi:DNA-binding CsgD family transcriptional regulator